MLLSWGSCVPGEHTNLGIFSNSFINGVGRRGMGSSEISGCIHSDRKEQTGDSFHSKQEFT